MKPWAVRRVIDQDQRLDSFGVQKKGAKALLLSLLTLRDLYTTLYVGSMLLYYHL